MVSDLFETLLQELGESMHIENLTPDRNNTCLIRFKTGLEIQIEPWQKGEFLLIGCPLGVVPPGKYRESVFREALKANGLPPPRSGVFAYGESGDTLMYYMMLSFRELTGDKIAAALVPFMEKALSWKQSLERGDVPLADIVGSNTRAGPGGLFGLIR